MNRAFTLIEVILALGITVIIGVILASSLWTANRAARSAEAASDEFRQTMTTADIVQSEIANCVPPTGTLEGPFIGTSDDLQFFTSGPEPKAAVQGDVREIEYTTAASAGTPGQNFIRRVATNLLAQVTAIPPDQVVCQDVDSIQFSYYDGNEWQDTWDSTQLNNTLPMAVRFTLTLLPAKQGDPPRVTSRVIPLSCFNPSASTTGTTTTGGG